MRDMAMSETLTVDGSPAAAEVRKLRIVLADDHNLVRQGISALLRTAPDVAVVGEAETGWQAVDMVRKLQPDVVVMDISMPELDGVEAAREILKHSSHTRVIMLSAYGDEEYVRELVKAGITGYLLKHTLAEELLTAIREAGKGKAFFSPSISYRLSQCYRTNSAPGTVPADAQPSTLLTVRERQILRLIAQGLANKQIAGQLNLSIKTIEKHRQNLMNKLKIHDIATLTRYAIAKGIVKAE